MISCVGILSMFKPIKIESYWFHLYLIFLSFTNYLFLVQVVYTGNFQREKWKCVYSNIPPTISSLYIYQEACFIGYENVESVYKLHLPPKVFLMHWTMDSNLAYKHKVIKWDYVLFFFPLPPFIWQLRFFWWPFIDYCGIMS